MAKLNLRLMHGTEIVKAVAADQKLHLATKYAYVPGDYYELDVAQVPAFVRVQLDAALRPAVIYVTKSPWRFTMPVNDQTEWPYPAGAFANPGHYAQVELVDESAVGANLALNSHDQHVDSGAYPHATANAETRGESVFFAKNAIDGYVCNESHGNYPYQSWGIDMREDAELTVAFGRPVTVAALGLLLRADYPHDSHWTAITAAFSDGSSEAFAPVKTADMQRFSFAARTVTWVKLTKLVKDADASAFPALTQIEVYSEA